MFPEQIEINVTQEDINLGIKGSPSSCPVARAINRLFPNATFIEVAADILVETNDPEFRSYWYNSTAQLEDFISDFDAGELVVPTIFYLDLDIAGSM